MKFIFFMCLVMACNPAAYAQTIKRFNAIYSYPGWDAGFFTAAKTQHVVSDSIYYYEKAKNSHDSALVTILYFNGQGNLAEQDEFNMVTHTVVKIVNYTYTDTLLTKQEIIEKSLVVVNDNEGLQREVRTFDHDSAGNITTEKHYVYFGNIASPSVTALSREYDAQGHLTKEYVTMPGKPPYLYRTCDYINSALSEEKIYDMQQRWMYSYIYEYDERTKTKSVYLLNQDKNLRSEYVYGGRQELIKEKSYSNRNLYWDHSTQEFNYEANGLLVSQGYHAANGDSFYFKHFYTRKKE
jgi:hypothetical protein